MFVSYHSVENFDELHNKFKYKNSNIARFTVKEIVSYIKRITCQIVWGGRTASKVHFVLVMEKWHFSAISVRINFDSGW